MAKIEEKLNEIKEKYKVETRAVVFDFNEFHKIGDYQTKIGDKLKDIDIGMLFLNAGYALPGAFADLTNMDVQQMCNINSLQPIYTAKVLVD